MQAIHHQTDTSQTKQALYKHFAAYIHTISLDELIESIERARLDAKLRHVVIYGAACSYCLGRAERLEGSYLRTFALELKGRRAETLAAAVTFLRRVKTEDLGVFEVFSLGDITMRKASAPS